MTGNSRTSKADLEDVREAEVNKLIAEAEFLEKEADYFEKKGKASPRYLQRFQSGAVYPENLRFLAEIQRGRAYRLENREELDALNNARWFGEVELLAEWIEQTGRLETREAREWVVARLRGEPQKRGRRTTSLKHTKWMALYCKLIVISLENECSSENEALKIYLSQDDDLNEDSVRTDLRRLKNWCREHWGGVPPFPNR